ncbi:hypothetical protein ABEB36_003199 [Hypothenemus hampei]|uniref:TIMELESS-interacting protein n=1 Tax=Hypothenemus hampei TaxID=57062 RepID=A0ABD1F8D9_HYPHA
MSSDVESLPAHSDLDENNEVLDIGEDLENEEIEINVQKEGEGEETDPSYEGVKPKRVVRNPQPKLNEETVKGPRGIAALPTYFDRVTFKGKGYEEQDLKAILKTYEYWCHRMFPKYPFDTCIERLEKLGSKKAVQTHIKRIRFDLLVEDKPIIDSSDEETNLDGFVDNPEPNLDEFDQLAAVPSIVVPDENIELTAEQLEKIRINKEKAEKLRQDRLKRIREKAEIHLQETNSFNNESEVSNNEGFSQASALDPPSEEVNDDAIESERLFESEESQDVQSLNNLSESRQQFSKNDETTMTFTDVDGSEIS